MWILLLAATLLVAGSARAQQTLVTPLNLPVSMQRIRKAVAESTPVAPLKGIDITGQPTFHVGITEQQFEEMLSKIQFEAPGPLVAGGADAYEQQQRLFPPTTNPLMQPYAPFTGGQMVTLGTEALLERYAGGPAIRAINAAFEARTEHKARTEVARALASYWTARNSLRLDSPSASKN